MFLCALLAIKANGVIPCSPVSLQYVIMHCLWYGLTMFLPADDLATCAPARLFCPAGQRQWQ